MAHTKATLIQIILRGVCFQFFIIFLLAFRRFKNWMTLKTRRWRPLFISFSFLEPSNFWIF
jgi:hypothetical protein